MGNAHDTFNPSEMTNAPDRPPMKPIPISAARRIADDYGYHQVIIIARRVGDEPAPHGEHVTTYGVNKQHCGIAAHIGDFIKHKIMGWAQS